MKFKIGNEELNFKMTNQTVFDLDEKYGNYGLIANGLMQGKNLYNNAIKIICASCKDKELEPKDIIEKLTSEQIEHELTNFAFELYLQYRGIRESNNSNNVKDIKKK